MNANELADLIGMCGDGGYNQDAATMLRQQQAEIEFLKKEILEKHEDWKHEGQQAANARAEIEALKEALQAVITISDRKHDAWDKAKELLK